MNKKIRVVHDFFDKHVPILFTTYDDIYIGFVKLYKCECKLWYGYQRENGKIEKCNGNTPCCVIKQFWQLLNHYEKKALADQFMRMGIDLKEIGAIK